MVKVFQYGSNCSVERINSNERLNGNAEFIGVAETVEEYELDFTVYSEGNECAAADMVKKEGCGKVYGALYEISDEWVFVERAKIEHHNSLGSIENEGKNYIRKEIKVICNDEEITALTYVVKDPKSGLKTNAAYVTHIIKGLCSMGVSQEYIDKVKRIAISNNPKIENEIKKL